jgi:hypothetical protein
MHLAIALGILLGELGYRGAGLIHILVKAEAPAIIERHGELKLRIDMLNSILLFDLEVLIDGSIVHHHMVYGVGIVEVTGDGHLFCGQSSSHFIPFVQQ